jgi:ethanolamine utilization protein EutQ (cupin superfamily)
MHAAGASEFEVTTHFDERTVDVDGMPFFIEGRLTMTASGRPDVDS